jgi:TolB protein
MAKDIRKIVVALIGTALVVSLAATPAEAAYPGSNGKIAFVRGSDIWTSFSDGSAQANLTNNAQIEDDPAWSPDGAQIAFTRYNDGVWVMDANGANQHRVVAFPGVPGDGPSWSPDQTKISFAVDGRCESGFPGAENGGVWVVNTDGTGLTQTGCIHDGDDRGYNGTGWSPDATTIAFGANLGTFDIYRIPPTITGSLPNSGTNITNNGAIDKHPNWKADNTKIVFDSDRGPGGATVRLWTMNPDGSAPALLPGPGGDIQGENPAWAPAGNEIVYDNSGGIYHADAVNGTFFALITTPGTNPDWQPVPPGYPRPKGATPMRIALVTANRACSAPNRTHGTPLAFPSCAPPQLSSDRLTVGTGDSNAKPALMQASIRLDVTGGDVAVEAELNDIFNKDLSDYTGGLRASLPVQITDKNNGPPSDPRGTVQSFPVEFDVGCTATADPNAGSDCALNTTLDSLVPGSVIAGKRAIWELGQAKVYDGGTDGNPTTAGDNTLFAVEGVFIP